MFNSDIALNATTVEISDQFRVKPFEEKPSPAPEEVAQNKRKWGLDPDRS